MHRRSIRAIAELLSQSLDAEKTRDIDVVSCSGPWAAPKLFAIMLSTGPDAAVVRRVAAARTGAISHASYIAPILHEATSPHLPLITLAVDGKTVLERRRGMLVVANAREYAVRINPAHRAVSNDSLLDFVFFPAENALDLVAWLLRSRLRSVGPSSGAFYLQAASARVKLELPQGYTHHAIQADGEAVSLPDAPVLDLHFEVVSAALRTLVPPGVGFEAERRAPASAAMLDPVATS
jgi:diacylglycerol kinase family enzyme